MYADIKFLVDRTAYWLGVKDLEGRRMITATDAVKQDFFRTKEYFRRKEKEIFQDKKATSYYKLLDSITLGSKV